MTTNQLGSGTTQLKIPLIKIAIFRKINCCDLRFSVRLTNHPTIVLLYEKNPDTFYYDILLLYWRHRTNADTKEQI